VSSLACKLVIRGFRDIFWNVLSTSCQVQWKVLEDYTLLSMTSEEQRNFDWKLNSSQRIDKKCTRMSDYTWCNRSWWQNASWQHNSESHSSCLPDNSKCSRTQFSFSQELAFGTMVLLISKREQDQTKHCRIA
jgi:hypothetical protein